MKKKMKTKLSQSRLFLPIMFAPSSSTLCKALCTTRYRYLSRGEDDEPGQQQKSSWQPILKRRKAF